MPVGVFIVGRLCGEVDRHQGYQVVEGIGPGMRRIAQHGNRADGEPDANLHRDQQEVRPEYPEENTTYPSLTGLVVPFQSALRYISRVHLKVVLNAGRQYAACRPPRRKKSMRDKAKLESQLHGLDGKNYGAYKGIAGGYDFGEFELHIDHVQGDPFAAPSRLRAVFDRDASQLPDDLLEPNIRRIAAADYLNRFLRRELARISRPRGSGKSGIVQILAPGATSPRPHQPSN